MREMNSKGELQGPEACFFQREKPTEELYDAVNDPGMVDNLAVDPIHRKTVERLSGALEDMRKRYGDLGETTEEELIEQGLLADRLGEYRERLQPLPEHLQIGPEPIPVTMKEAAEYSRESL